MKKSELSSDFFLVDVNPNGAKMFPVKYQSACIVYNKKTKEFLLYGDANGTDIIFLEKVPGVPLRFYPENFISCNYREGKVFLVSEMTGKATIVTGIFNWTDEHLIWEKEEVYDPSEWQVKRATVLAKSGEVYDAILTYDSVKYADVYYNAQKVGIELLMASVPVVQNLTTKHKTKEALDLAEKVLNFKGMKWLNELKTESDLKTFIGKGLFGLLYADLQEYIVVYVSLLVESKQLDLAITKIQYYLKFFTKSADLMLNLADAYYAKKDKTKASECYERYVNQAKELKREKEIPYYVDQRIIK